MNRFLTATSGLALVAALALPAGAATKAVVHNHSSHRVHTSTKATSCPKGDVFVKGYKTKAGKVVKGYCRAPKAHK